MTHLNITWFSDSEYRVSISMKTSIVSENCFRKTGCGTDLRPMDKSDTVAATPSSLSVAFNVSI
jgi:hypothetical protein